MSLAREVIGVLTIPAGAAASGSLRQAVALGGLAFSDGQIKVLGAARRITIIAPSTLTGTVKVQTSPDAGTSWRYVNDEGTQVIVAANESRDFGPAGMDDLRLLSSASEGAARDFKVIAQHDLN